MLYEALKASKGIYTDDTLAKIWGAKLRKGGIVESSITGNLPLTFDGLKAAALRNYRLYGTSEGAGVETESGEPEGYKIPLTVTSGQNTDTYPLYVGSSKLDAEEYLDYAEQKVYKRASNIVDWSKITTTATSVNVQDNTTTLSSKSGSTLYPAVFFETSSHGDSLGMVNGKTYVLTYNVVSAAIPSEDTARKSVCLRDANNQIVKRDSNDLSVIGQHAFKFVYNTGLRLSILLSRLQTSQRSTIVLSDFVLTELAPTDPPAPLPEITAYEGENTLSSTETVGEVTITGYIKEQGE